MSNKARFNAIQQRTIFISCIVPVFNEEKNVAAFFPALTNELKKLTDRYEIIVVDDGSHDETMIKILQLPKEFCIKALRFYRNRLQLIMLKEQKAVIYNPLFLNVG